MNKQELLELMRERARANTERIQALRGRKHTDLQRMLTEGRMCELESMARGIFGFNSDEAREFEYYSENSNQIFPVKP